MANGKIVQPFQTIVNGVIRYITHTRLNDRINQSNPRKSLGVPPLASLRKWKNLKLSFDWYMAGMLEQFKGKQFHGTCLYARG